MRHVSDDSLPLDPDIEPYVVALWEADVDTFESCQGGPGHAALEPMVMFHGDVGEGPRVLGIALNLGLPVSELRRLWHILDGEANGPYWALTFRSHGQQTEDA